MELVGTSVKSVHATKPTAGVSTSAAANPATRIDFLIGRLFICCPIFRLERAESLELDTKASRDCARARIVQIVDTAGGHAVDACVGVYFRIVARVIREQGQIVSREINPRAPPGAREPRQI